MMVPSWSWLWRSDPPPCLPVETIRTDLAEIDQRTQRLERRVAIIEDRIAAIRGDSDDDVEGLG